MDRFPGISAARWVIEHADPRAESPAGNVGASCISQRRSVRAAVQRVDMRRTAMVSGRPSDPGDRRHHRGRWSAEVRQSRGRRPCVIADDRERERLLRALGFGIVRYNWTTAIRRPGDIVYRATQAARLRGANAVPTCWHPRITLPLSRAHDRSGFGNPGTGVDPIMSAVDVDKRDGGRDGAGVRG